MTSVLGTLNNSAVSKFSVLFAGSFPSSSTDMASSSVKAASTFSSSSRLLTLPLHFHVFADWLLSDTES